MTMPVQPMSMHQVMEKAATPGADLQGLSDRFNRLMVEHPPQEMRMPAPPDESGTPATRFVRAQEDAMRQTFDDVRTFSMQAPTVSMPELSARHIALSYQLAMVQLQFNAGTYVAQSSKSGLQTLMKNQ